MGERGRATTSYPWQQPSLPPHVMLSEHVLHAQVVRLQIGGGGVGGVGGGIENLVLVDL